MSMDNENKNVESVEENNTEAEVTATETVSESKENVIVRLGKTLWRWAKRMFFGASKELAESDIFAVEKLESPSKLAVKTFFRRKLAVAALVVLLSLFLFVFIGPLFIPMDLNYTDPLQANIAPNYSMLKVPRGLKKNIRDINGFSNFTVGVSEDNNFYIWGYTKDALTKVDYEDIPEEVADGEVFMASAGSDHIIVITTAGKIIGWGNNTRGQYGPSTEESVIAMPDEFVNGTVDTSKVQQLITGYQATGMVYDGQLYLWGNSKALLNMKETLDEAKLYCETNNTRVKQVAFTNYNAIVLYEDGKVTTGGAILGNASAVSSTSGKVNSFMSVLSGKTVVDIAATNNCYVFVTSTGEIYVQGAAEYGEDKIAAIPAGEKVVSVKSGTRHIAVITDKNHVYSWGHNDHGQTDVNGEDASEVYLGAKQTYLANEEGKLTERTGLKGYMFGTDNRGRDTFTRIVHGGKMTMTIGAVAVIVSTIIAIIIGCLSGYFGGWVDMLLMRVTEIFSAIPFLPFAMMLSYIIRNYPIGETTRIFIIMVILGLLSWTGLARMIRGQVLAEREKEFVTAAKSMGVKESRIAFKHILPNVISVILVSVTLDFAGCLLTESSLSYLGFGVQLPQPTWGNMLDGANNSIVIQNYWWQWVFPSIFLSIATISINIIGDTLRDVLDPKSSREK